IADNVISGNNQDGVALFGNGGGTSALVRGNLIGTDATGSSALGNRVGVEIERMPATIGGTGVGDGNVISGNQRDGIDVFNLASADNVISANAQDGIVLTGNGSTANIVQGNQIGVGAYLATKLGNATNGVFITDGASNNTVGVAENAPPAPGTTGPALNVIAY